MIYSLAFHPEVNNDILNSYVWYESQRPGLGDGFILSIEATLENIRRNPEHFPLSDEATRKALLFRFPFVVIYQIINNQVLILAVFHSSRNPDTIQGRTE
jgi:plasmid stabilization system protein ParE